MSAIINGRTNNTARIALRHPVLYKFRFRLPFLICAVLHKKKKRLHPKQHGGHAHLNCSSSLSFVNIFQNFKTHS